MVRQPDLSEVNMSHFIGLAQQHADQYDEAVLVLLGCDPKEQWPYKAPYFVSEDSATKWERDNFHQKVTPSAKRER